ncbi:MAG: HipA family kinase [Veillonellales bacterium]
MLTGVKYLGAVGLGVTSPQLFRADDGKIYVVKLQNNCLGTKVLANEYLASQFAGVMDLCFPPGEIIYISDQVLQKSRRLKAKRVNKGPHFASRYIGGSRYVVRNNLYKAVNKTKLAGVMLFDHLFHNLDRTWNRRNLIIRREDQGGVVYAIDNSHLFRRGRWNINSLTKLESQITLNHRRAYGWLLKHFLTAGDFAPYVAKVKALSDEQITGLVENIPLQWLPDQAERQALIHYIRVRRDMVEEIAGRLYALIPNVDRSADPDQGK